MEIIQKNILIIIIIIIIWFTFIPSKNKITEHFYWDPLWVGKRALDCYELGERDCMKYSNCGLCAKDGKMNCIPGDAQGPFFKEDCEHWTHTNFYDRHIFGERVTTTTPPWNRFYPDYEARWPSPISRATL